MPNQPDHLRAIQVHAIRKRIERCPEDYYIGDDGSVLYALLAGQHLWSMPAPPGENFHAMRDSEIAQLIREELERQFNLIQEAEPT